MPSFSQSRPKIEIAIPPALLVATFCILGLAGGASRTDVIGQAIVSAFMGVLLAITVLRNQINWRAHRVLFICLVVAVAMPVVQLLPLPPEIWHSLPGRDIIIEGDRAAGLGRVWRPISMMPSATLATVFSFWAPVTTFSIMADRRAVSSRFVAKLVVTLAVASALVALVQFSGSSFDNPLINETLGVPSGLMANRNHQALLLAIGIVTLPLALLSGTRVVWARFALVAILAIWMLLMILATGSRAGIILGMIASLAACVITVSTHRQVNGRSRSMIASGIFVLLAALLGMSMLAVSSERAKSFDRLASMDVSDDLRAKTLPTVVKISKYYFPIGSGAGTFDPVFRLHEPLYLLKPTYFNHAHNDYLETIIEFGILGAVADLAAILLWLTFSLRAWRKGSESSWSARTGSIIILLVLIASIADYPARTPTIMALVVVAAFWLLDSSKATKSAGHAALPY